MAEKGRYYIVRERAVPEVLLKVVEAKRLLETDKALSVHEAAEQVGISRSSFYKYQDDILPFHDETKGKTVTFVLQMRDEPGLLSTVLKTVAEFGANILTINQSIPAGGGAVVSVGAETSELTMTTEEMLEQVAGEKGVVRCEILGG